MKILITGAYGFVGTNLCKFLVAKGHQCHALDVPAARRDEVPYASFHTWDELGAVFAGDAYDAVVHLAGKAHDLKKVSSPQSYFDINVGLTQKIFTAASGKAPRFIYFSSIKALDGDTPYAQSKRAAEAWLKEQTSTTRIVALEPAMIHGPGNKGNLNLLVQVVRKGIPWPLAAFENLRSFTSIGNICAVVEALAAVPSDAKGFDAYQAFPMCDDAPVSTNRLIALIAEAYGRKARLLKLPKGLMRTAAAVGTLLHLPLNTERLGKLTENSIVENAAVKRALGWDKMPIAAEDGLRATLASFVQEG